MKYTKEFLISEIQNFHTKFNKIPVKMDFSLPPNIHYGHFERTFGSWGNALKESGFLTNKERLELIISTYNQNPKKCSVCGNNIPYECKENNHCSKSCGGISSNKQRVVDGWKMSDTTKNKISKALLGRKSSNPNIIANMNNYELNPRKCNICDKNLSYENRNHQTCSEHCKNIQIGNKSRENTNCGGSTKQYISYTDSFGNNIWLDSSWELILANQLDKNNIKWVRPKMFRLLNNQRYTPDFYLTDYDIYLDPKAFRKGYLKQIEKINRFEQEFSTTCLVISNIKDLTWEYINDKIIGA